MKLITTKQPGQTKQTVIGCFDSDRDNIGKIYIAANLIFPNFPANTKRLLGKKQTINGFKNQFYSIKVVNISPFIESLLQAHNNSYSVPSMRKQTSAPGSIITPQDKNKILAIINGLNEFAQPKAVRKYTYIKLEKHAKIKVFTQNLVAALQAYIDNLLTNSPTNPATIRNCLFSHTTDKQTLGEKTSRQKKIHRVIIMKQRVQEATTIQQLCAILDAKNPDNEILNAQRFLGLKKPNGTKLLEWANNELASTLQKLQFEIALGDGDTVKTKPEKSNDNDDEEEYVYNLNQFGLQMSASSGSKKRWKFV